MGTPPTDFPDPLDSTALCENKTKNGTHQTPRFALTKAPVRTHPSGDYPSFESKKAET